MMRKIDTIILHCSDTIEGKDFNVKDIDAWHKANGWCSPSGVHCGYHFVVLRDGTVEQGRPVSEVGAHAGKKYNPTSVGICYIGGKGKDGKPKDTRTPQQKNSLVDLVLILQHQYHIKTENILCHCDITNKACPCFTRESFIKELSE